MMSNMVMSEALIRMAQTYFAWIAARARPAEPGTATSRRSQGEGFLLKRQVHIGRGQETSLEPGPCKLLMLGVWECKIHSADRAEDLMQEILIAVLHENQFACTRTPVIASS